MYSDVSLEDVQDLNHKLEMLQQQVTNLADNSETKHARAKTETAVLQAKYHMLEVSVDQLWLIMMVFYIVGISES